MWASRRRWYQSDSSKWPSIGKVEGTLARGKRLNPLGNKWKRKRRKPRILDGRTGGKELDKKRPKTLGPKGGKVGMKGKETRIG